MLISSWALDPLGAGGASRWTNTQLVGLPSTSISGYLSGNNSARSEAEPVGPNIMIGDQSRLKVSESRVEKARVECEFCLNRGKIRERGGDDHPGRWVFRSSGPRRRLPAKIIPIPWLIAIDTI